MINLKIETFLFSNTMRNRIRFDFVSHHLAVYLFINITNQINWLSVILLKHRKNVYLWDYNLFH